jgi:GNAT superfamily N-acetyltransferase
MKFEFDLPKDFEIQFYYLQSRVEPMAVSFPGGYRFLMLSNPMDAFAVVSLLMKAFGSAQTAKTFVKLITANRRFYIVCDSATIVSWGWCTVGKNNFYRVESDAMTIGPIETVEQSRGKGLASQALKAAINHHIDLGIHRFYIDTHQRNIAAQKSFVHAGFNQPCGFYRR